MPLRRLPLAASAALLLAFITPALSSDDDGKPDSHTFELDVSTLLGKTIVVHAWDTIQFANQGQTDVTATFLAGDPPLAPDPANMKPTRDRGTYWDGTDVVNSGRIPPGAYYWVTIIEYGTFQFYDVFRPDVLGTVVVVPETRHIPNEGTPLDAAAIAADPNLTALVDAAK